MTPEQTAEIITLLRANPHHLASSRVTAFEFVFALEGTPERVVIEIHDSGARTAGDVSRYRCDIKSEDGTLLVSTGEHYDDAVRAITEAIEKLLET